MDGLYTVLVVDGEAADLCDIDTNVLRYDRLTWEESVELVRLSFVQGYQAVIWKQSAENQDGGAAECGEA